MRLSVENARGQIARICLLLTTAAALAACGGTSGGVRSAGDSAMALPVNGPQADYPVLVGNAYTIGDITFTPADVLNYDEVGLLTVDAGEGITGAHHTLPVPSYVEVTSLETGRTILVRLERRGPMDSTDLVALSPAAVTQLGSQPGTPVRVRRVNPPEDQRYMLRAGLEAPLRMDTPMGLVTVLRRRLPGNEVSVRNMEPQAQDDPPVAEPASGPAPVIAGAVPPASEPEEPGLPSPSHDASFEQAFAGEAAIAPPAPSTAPGQVLDAGFVVQAAAFSTQERADRAAEALGGSVSRSGRYFRVRTGPFLSRSQAEASLANVRAAGYEDARIYTTG